MRELVCLHAAGSGPGTWDGVRPGLEGLGYRVHCLTLAGHGAAERRTAYRLEGFKDDVLREIDWLGPVTLVGHSLGAFVATQVAVEGRVERLVLEELPVPPKDRRRWTAQREGRHRDRPEGDGDAGPEEVRSEGVAGRGDRAAETPAALVGRAREAQGADAHPCGREQESSGSAPVRRGRRADAGSNHRDRRGRPSDPHPRTRASGSRQSKSSSRRTDRTAAGRPRLPTPRRAVHGALTRPASTS